MKPASITRAALSLFALLLWASSADSIRFWRRRRRSCRAVNCQWKNWSAWGPCNHPCGSAGSQRRTRGVATQPACNGAACPGVSAETRGCNRGCDHGGTERVGFCLCPPPRWGTCCETPCTAIANCELLSCTSGQNHKCNKCKYTKNANTKAYKRKTAEGVANRICQQVCSWRLDSSFCYPGKCPEAPSSCSCAENFGSPNCLQISKKPSITACLLTGQKKLGTAVIDFVDTKCVTKTSPVVFTNILLNTVKIDWKSLFKGPTAASYPKPVYVTAFQVGIVSASASWQIKRGSKSLAGQSSPCMNDISKLKPDQNLHVCEQNLPLDSTRHGDEVKVELHVTNGGFVKVLGEGTKGIQTHYYRGQQLLHTASFTIDTNKPRHCFAAAAAACDKDSLLHITSVFTKSGSIRVTWDGWSDDLSGMKEYELELTKLKAFGSVLGPGSELSNEKLALTVQQKTFSVSEPGVYSVLLVVKDVAGNHGLARRFFIFDDVYTITVSTAADEKLYISSAAQDSAYLWITSLQNANKQGPKVTAMWSAHFANEYHHNNKFLAAIKANLPAIDSFYEDSDGVGDDIRSLKAIDNVNAIVRYQVALDVDNKGGRTLTSPPVWTDVNNFQTETVDLDAVRSDGDSVRVWVRAFDIVGNTVDDSVLVHVDSSPPLTSGVSLARHGRQQLAVHHSRDLFNLKLMFDAVDVHSGLKEIRWELVDKAEPSVEHGSGHIAVRRPTSQDLCDVADCYCIAKDTECYFRNYEITPDMSKMAKAEGDHDFDYHFVITVTNNAMLKTVVTYQITVDESAPQSGQVSDSRPRQPDIDFQQGFVLQASWQGFFDRESGILFYQYAFSDKCLPASDFTIPADNAVTEVTQTSASLTVTGVGTYHCTVVAYNRALTPSAPACSDGVTVDTTPPTLVEVTIENTHVQPSMLKDSGGRVWYINRDRYRIEIKSASASCRDKTKADEKILLYPIKIDDEKHDIDWEEQCRQLSPPDSSIFISKANLLDVSWFGSDKESGIEDYQVGLSESGSIEPQLSPYASSHAHRHYKLYHANLVNDAVFYVHIKATNRAQLTTTQVIGPLTVRLEPPVFTGSIQLKMQNSYLVASWNSGAFAKNDLDTGFISGYYYAVGHDTVADDLVPFTPLPTVSVPGICERTVPPSCVAVPLTQLQWHLQGRHTYHVSLRLDAANRLNTLARSEAYEHLVGPPSPGLVYEVPLTAPDSPSTDIDHQVNSTALHIEWHGFTHIDQTIKFKLGIGTEPGTDDTVPFSPVSTQSKLLSKLTLTRLTTYYATVQATTADGTTTVSSDGITILPLDEDVAGVTVMDGMPCLGAGSVDPCGKDIDFQASRTVMAIQWSLPANIVKFITNIKWKIEKKQDSEWTELQELSAIEPIQYVIAGDLHLEGGHTYRAAVQFCHPEGCFQFVYSDGVGVIPDPPTSGGIVEAVFTADTKTLAFRWAAFVTGYGNALDEHFLDRHEWTVLTRDHRDAQLFMWLTIPTESVVCDDVTAICSYEVLLPVELEPSTCLVLAVRAYTKAGLYQTVYTNLVGCDVATQTPLLVLDAVGDTDTTDIHLDQTTGWPHAEAEYTPYMNTLSAVWPTLRHPAYLWKILSATDITRWAYVKPSTELRYEVLPSSSLAVLANGRTVDNSVTVHGLTLQEGQRYYVCIAANETEIHYETFTQKLAAVSACSNGITPDNSPPTASKVWTGSWQKHSFYQVDQMQLMIYWEDFVDVEVYDSASHDSAILKYEYAIGSSAGGIDVRDYVSVDGLANSILATGLQLQDGHTYYATIRATDHVGRTVTGSSTGVTIDTSPPDVGETLIDVGGAYQTSPQSQLSASWWNVFTDIESGIRTYYWCIGSNPGYCNLMSYTETSQESASSSDSQTTLQLHDGHAYYISVQAVNGAGLSRVVTSSAIVVDVSGPEGGRVYEVADGADDVDIDYTSDLSVLRVRWHSFHEPHSHIVEYHLSVGRCAGCDDLLASSSVALRTGVDLRGLGLRAGQRYYSTVKACSAAQLCATVTSDGLIPDDSPPQAGRLLDGLAGDDIDYQQSRSRVTAHMYNTEDSESSLSHIEWRIGTATGAHDIMPARRVEICRHMTVKVTNPLPLDKRIYSTVKVFNKAGLFSETSSDGFHVDNTAPVIQQRVQLFEEEGSFSTNTLVWKSSLAVHWHITDPDSPVLEQFISVITTEASHIDIPTIKLYGDVRKYTFTNVSLADGGVYYVKVIACNGAKLCTESISEGILVDNSPPLSGALAIETEHAASLTRHRDVSMTYAVTGATTTLSLAWLGFSEPHTRIAQYHVAVGTTYGSSSLLPNREPARLMHSEDIAHKDEGFVQKLDVVISKAVQAKERLYLSIWAENQVGLLSSRLHATLEMIPAAAGTGSLELVRRCDPVSCEGHCTCAKHGLLLCDKSTSCNDVKGQSGYAAVSVYDITNYRLPHATNQDDSAHTRTQCALAATWRPAGGTSSAPIRYEWSVGLEGEPIGAGLFDQLHEPLWRETGTENMAVYTTEGSLLRDVSLKPLVIYQFHVRAWYSKDHFGVYSTDGVLTDFSAPELSRSIRVVELAALGAKGDVDFVVSATRVTVSWRNVFRDAHSDVMRYVVAVGRHRGATDVVTREFGAGTTETTLDGLALTAARPYYTTVTAYNKAGLSRAAFSDGFQVDASPPLPGQVWDGAGVVDIDHSSDADHASASWRGFTDDESFIDHYILCVGSTPGGSDVLACKDVGLRTSMTADITAAATGSVLYSTVSAVNGAGSESESVTSTGVVIDTTPPQPIHRFNVGANLVVNPSFEGDGDVAAGVTDGAPSPWTVAGGGRVRVHTGAGAQDGEGYLELVAGEVRQAVGMATAQKYRLTFHVRAVVGSEPGLGYVRLPHARVAFLLPPASPRWHRHIHYFVATAATTDVAVGVLAHRTGFLLDSVDLRPLDEGMRPAPTDPSDPEGRRVQPVRVHVDHRGARSAVVAAWDMVDVETAAVKYRWAIGKVKGGVQLQDFTAVGAESHGRTESLELVQSSELHVTVLAENSAGLRTVVYADPVKVDFTPPLICCLKDGGEGDDVKYQKSKVLTIRWTVKDEETGVKSCKWAVGQSPGSQEVLPFTPTTTLSTAIRDFSDSVSHGQTLFATVRCLNYAGLSATASFDGVTVVTAAPDISLAVLRVTASSASHFPTSLNHQAKTDGVYFGWKGIRDAAGIAFYKVRLLRAEDSTTVVPSHMIDSASVTSAAFEGLSLTAYNTYRLDVTATNVLGLESSAFSTEFTVETEPPSVIAPELHTEWPEVWKLTMRWTGMFSSNSTLTYEIIIGTTVGGIDVRRERGRVETELTLTGMDSKTLHYVTVTAFNRAGHYTANTYEVSYTKTTKL